MKIISTRVLIVGVSLLFVPLIAFDWHSSPEGKIAAFRSMLMSLSELFLISFALWFKVHLRQREQWEENRVLLNNKFLKAMIAKKNQPVNSVQKFR